MRELLRWGILGTASISETVIPAIQSCTGSRIAAVASRTQARADEWAARYAIPLAFSSYDDLLHSGEVDLIYLPLPNSLHAEWTIRALEAGLHVLCEKPLALDAREAHTIAEAAKQSGRLAAEAYMYRHHPVYARLQELVAEGSIGRVKSIHSEFSFMDDEPDTIVANAELGGGALMDVGCYCVNASRLIEGAEPRRVSAFARLDPVDFSLVGLLEFPSGTLATFTTSIESAERHRLEIHGESGMLVLKSPWHPGDQYAQISIQRHGEADERVSVAGDDPYYLEAQEFVEACAGKRPLRWPIADAVANMAVLDALKVSAREGRAVAPNEAKTSL